MISEEVKFLLKNSLKGGYSVLFFSVFYKYAKRGKILVKRKRFKKNRRYIRLTHFYRDQKKKFTGIKGVTASMALEHLNLYRKINIEVNYIPKRFKRHALPWRLIRR